MKGKIKDKIIATKGFSHFGREYGGHLGFALRLLVWILIIFWVTVLAGWGFIKLFHPLAQQTTFEDFILLITAGLVAAYAYETHKTTEQIKENDLRPIILRSGFIENWSALRFSFEGPTLISGMPIEFRVLHGIATDIVGYVVKDGFKYELLFGNDISKVGERAYFFHKHWGWMGPETSAYAVFKDEERKQADEENKIFLSYRDVEGVDYVSIEDKDFTQKSFRW